VTRRSEALAIEPRGPLEATVRVPGSKSITNRALLIAALAEGESELVGPLTSVDTDVMRRALESLGARIEGAGERWRVHGMGGRFEPPSEPIWIENSGTSARFLTACLTLGKAPVVLDGNARMRERPIDDLCDALGQLGAAVEVLGERGCPPVRVQGGGLPGGHALMDVRRTSSQFVSAIALSAPYAQHDVTIEFVDNVLVSRPYVDLTLQVMREFGAQAGWTPEGHLQVTAGRTYRPRRSTIEPDASSAVYPFCAAAIAGGIVRVDGIPAASAQPDFRVLGLLQRMGCQVRRFGETVEVQGPADGLRSLGEVDMNDLPDAALAYAVVALFANGPTVIRNVPNLRIKETDRLHALETELRRLGARATAGPDSIAIQPGPLHGAAIETYDDHRMAMAFSLAGLRVPGVAIHDPTCVSKTWPNYFDVFRHL